MVDPFLPLKLASAMFVLVLVARLGFDKPTWCRTYTTMFRFRVASTAYALTQILAMLLLYLILRWLFVATEAMGSFGGLIRPSSPVWLAFACTALLFTVPAIAGGPRRLLQLLAGVPNKANELASALREAELSIDDVHLAEARSLLEHRGIDGEQHWLPQARAVQALLLRATVLHLLLRKWPGDARFTTYVTVAKNDLDLMRQRFEELSLRISHAFGTMERLGEIKQLLSAPEPPALEKVDDLIRKIIGDMLRDTCADISEFCSHGCLLIARGIMATEPTAKARRIAIAALGFRLKRMEEPAGFGAIAVAAGLLYFGVALFFALIGTGAQHISTAYLVLIITLTQVGALVIAIVPTTRWGFANAGLRPSTPVAFVVAAGASAVMWAVMVNVIAGALLIGGWEGSLTRLRDAAPYLVSPFSTAAATAWLVQDHRWHGFASPRVRQLLDAATMACVWLLVSAFATELKGWLVGTDVMVMDVARAMAGGFVIGGVVGYVVPSAFRVNERTACPARTICPVPVRIATRSRLSQGAVG